MASLLAYEASFRRAAVRRATDLALGFTFALLLAAPVLAAECTEKSLGPGWIGQKHKGPVVVFVHGILSDPIGAWSDAGHYWPRIVCADERLGRPSVFVASYYSSWNSQSFSIPDAADSLAGQLQSEGVLRHRDILIVAHSLGGIVVRDMLSRLRAPGDQFAGKRIGLLFLSSPALGSPLARQLSFVVQAAGNTLARQLQPEDATLSRIHTAFWNLAKGKQANRGIVVSGVELFESQSVDVSCLIGKPLPLLQRELAARFLGQAAPIRSAGWYFSTPPSRSGADWLSRPRQLGGVDHCGIAKPHNRQSDSYVELFNLFTATFFEGRNAPPSAEDRMDVGLPQAELFILADDKRVLASKNSLTQFRGGSLLAHAQGLWPGATSGKVGIRVSNSLDHRFTLTLARLSITGAEAVSWPGFASVEKGADEFTMILESEPAPSVSRLSSVVEKPGFSLEATLTGFSAGRTDSGVHEAYLFVTDDLDRLFRIHLAQNSWGGGVSGHNYTRFWNPTVEMCVDGTLECKRPSVAGACQYVMLDLPVPGASTAYHYANLHLTDARSTQRYTALSDERQVNKAVAVLKNFEPGMLTFDYEMTGAPPNVVPALGKQHHLQVRNDVYYRLRAEPSGGYVFEVVDQGEFLKFTARPDMPRLDRCIEYQERVNWVVNRR
jgi:pimeloyl-ACP methyl ester carboxylesterase